MDGESVFYTDHNEELDIIGTNYYKLPFCDEDVKQLKDLDWMNDYEDLLTPSSPSSSSCHSQSSSNSSGNQQLITDRPDTPLIAVKLEDFSNDCELNDFPQNLTSDLTNWSQEWVGDSAFADDKLENAKFVFEGNTAELTYDNEPPKIVQANDFMKDKVTLDRTLTSSIYEPFEEKQQLQDSLTVLVKDEENDQEIMDFCSAKPISSQIPIITSKPNKKAPVNTSVYLAHSNNANVFTLPTTGSQIELVTDSTARGTKRCATVLNGNHKTQIQIPTSTLHTILKSGRLITKLQQEGQLLPRIKIKTEPGTNDQCVTICQPQIDVQLPPTPNSTHTSDSESSGNRYSAPPSPGGKCKLMDSATATQLTAQMLTSPQRLSQSHGPLVLTEEEKRTLVAEGYSIPARLPLTKGEEKALKKVRRKIKNKISAQESRRKKKEYVEALEKKMESYNQENSDLRRKLDSLETSNKSLLSQLRSLQMLVAGKMPKPSRTVTTQTSSCLMIFVLCFAMFLGGWYPRLSPNGVDIMTSSAAHPMMPSQIWQSRVLAHVEQETVCIDKIPIGDTGEKDHNNNDSGKVADETYESPKTGRIVMNDTGDSKMIRNTMEPRDAAAVIASRKMAVENGAKMGPGQNGVPPVDMDQKKVVVVAPSYVKE